MIERPGMKADWHGLMRLSMRGFSLFDYPCNDFVEFISQRNRRVISSLHRKITFGDGSNEVVVSLLEKLPVSKEV